MRGSVHFNKQKIKPIVTRSVISVATTVGKHQFCFPIGNNF